MDNFDSRLSNIKSILKVFPSSSPIPQISYSWNCNGSFCFRLRQPNRRVTYFNMPFQLVFRKKSDPIRICRSNPSQIGSDHIFYDSWFDSNQKIFDPFRFKSNRIRSDLIWVRIGSNRIRFERIWIRSDSIQVFVI